jgi:hypothetical protein
MYIPSVKKTSFPLRGPTSSRQLNDFVDQVANDIMALSQEITVQDSNERENFKTIMDEMRYLNRKIAQLEKDREFEKEISTRNGLRTTYFQSMYKVNNLNFISNNAYLRPIVSASYGIAHLPVNAVESKFYSNSIYDGDVLTPSSLSVVTSGTFIPDGETEAVNYDLNATKVIEGNPKNAFNGNNRSYWVREVHFDASSDITEVQVELIATLPSQNNTMSNVLAINPYPLGSVDVMDISFSADLTQSWSRMQHPDAPYETSPDNNATQKKYIFTPQDIDQVRVRLRTRNFLEENGKKIFRLGLQELGLFLVDFEKSGAGNSFSQWSNQTDAENISMVHTIEAPDDCVFKAIHSFKSTPDITLEDDSNRHVVFRIYDGDPVTSAGNELWNSNQTYPQNQPDSVGAQITVGGNVNKLYVVTSMRFVDSSGGSSGPFYGNTSPYIESFALEASAVQRF